MNNGTMANTLALPRFTPAEAGARAAWADAQATPVDRMTGKITHGDCLKVLRQLPDACADMVLTHPPYLVRYHDRSGRRVPNDDNARWIFPAFWELYRVLKPGSYAVSLRLGQGGFATGDDLILKNET